MHHLWKPLHRQAVNLHIGWAADGTILYPVNATSVQVGNLTERSTREEHHAACRIMLRRVEATVSTPPVVISARPDLVWFEDVPTIGNVTGAHMRARSAIGYHMVQSQTSWGWWRFPSGSHSPRSLPCATLMHAKPDCLTFDDQFAILDAAAAHVYWGDEMAVHATTGPDGCRMCGETGWPEGAVTCRLLGAGIRLHLLAWAARLAKYRMDHAAKYNCYQEKCCTYACDMPCDPFWIDQKHSTTNPS